MKVLVTGAGGFLGGALVQALLARDYTIHTLQRGHYESLQQDGMTNFVGDICVPDSVNEAASGCDMVFHVAAKAGVWGDYEEYYRSNVIGTKNILSACKQQGISSLVYTSSPSVIFAGKDEEGVDESIAYSANMMTHYQRTKAAAERLVMQSNSAELATVCLRPHLMWGPGDTQLIPRIIERAKTGRLRLIDDPGKLIDATYIDNAVMAHLLAADALKVGAACAGKTYFIGNGEPVTMASLVNGILTAANMPAVTKTVQPGLLYLAGSVVECIYTVFAIKQEPCITRFIARQLSCSHWYDLSAARRDFGYQPEVSIATGLIKLSDSFKAG